MSLVATNIDASVHIWFSNSDFDQKYEKSICSDGRKKVRPTSWVFFMYIFETIFYFTNFKQPTDFSGSSGESSDDPQGRIKVYYSLSQVGFYF